MQTHRDLHNTRPPCREAQECQGLEPAGLATVCHKGVQASIHPNVLHVTTQAETCRPDHRSATWPLHVLTGLPRAGQLCVHETRRFPARVGEQHDPLHTEERLPIPRSRAQPWSLARPGTSTQPPAPAPSAFFLPRQVPQYLSTQQLRFHTGLTETWTLPLLCPGGNHRTQSCRPAGTVLGLHVPKQGSGTGHCRTLQQTGPLSGAGCVKSVKGDASKRGSDMTVLGLRPPQGDRQPPACRHDPGPRVTQGSS